MQEVLTGLAKEMQDEADLLEYARSLNAKLMRVNELRQTTMAGVLDGLRQQNATLSEVQKQVEEFLGTKRQAVEEHLLRC